LKVATQQGE